MKLTVDQKKIRKAELIEKHGPPLAQLLAIQSRLLNAFENPENWPMTDEQRCGLLRQLYHAAKVLQECQA